MKYIYLILICLLYCINLSAQKEVKLELFVRCCMGEINPLIAQTPVTIYKDSTYIFCIFDSFIVFPDSKELESREDSIIVLPDTGTYKLESGEGEIKIRHFDEYKIYRDTFEVHDVGAVLEYDEVKHKYKKEPIWKCSDCVMDGYFVHYYPSGQISWEAKFKNGILLYDKNYFEDGTLEYYMKRTFWGKEKTINCS